ncbi:MAG: hypothetical protein AAGH78_07710 [Cyanobacteria bacterium P01_H01_bin.58]
MSRYVLFAILVLVAILTLRGVSDIPGFLSVENAPAEENLPETQPNFSTPSTNAGAFGLDQAGQNVRRLASQNGTSVSDLNQAPVPDDLGSGDQQATGAGATGVTGTPAPTNQDPIPALW